MLQRFESKYKIGDKVSDIVLKEKNDTIKTLYQLNSKYTIINFGSSWCAPCRELKKNAFTRLLKKYSRDELNIYSVYFDRKQSWIKDVANDPEGLISVLDSSTISNTMKNFKPDYYPFQYVVDKNFKVVGKSTFDVGLESFIDQLIKN